jgi:hypothetical protein
MEIQPVYERNDSQDSGIMHKHEFAIVHML